LWDIDAETKKANQISPETETLLNFVDISQSADGRIFYSKLEGNEVNIYSVDSAGKDVKQITSKGWNMGAHISSDGKYILTTGKSEDGYNGILRLNLDGTNPVFLTKIKDKTDMMPQSAPDGTVVFVRLGLDWSFPKLMKVNINGGEVSNIFNDNQKLEIYPSLSPDGKYLAFVNFFADSVANSVRMKMKVVEFADGNAGKIVLENEIPQVTRFAWSKDSKDLIYLEPVKKMNLLKISIAEKNESVMSDFTSRVMEGAFTFSNDGKKIYAVRSSDSRELVLIKNVGEN
jgi:Tol biopolymer transport system component